MKFEVSSKLKLSPQDVAGLLTMEGVNRELRPLIRMTVPREWSGKAISEWPAGQVLFSSWILLFGILPIDRHTFCFQEIDRQRGFSETSTSLTNRLWHHRRSIDCNEQTCLVTDIVEVEPRLSFLAYVLGPVYRFVFKHRHKLLRSRFGACVR